MSLYLCCISREVHLESRPSKGSCLRRSKNIIMGGDNDTREALRHFTASGIAAVVNFPLWRAAAIGQSGFVLEGSNVLVRYWKAVMPGTMPYRGVSATMLGMTWARGAIFFGSQKGKQMLKDNGYDANTAQLLPPLVISTFVQFANTQFFCRI